MKQTDKEDKMPADIKPINRVMIAHKLLRNIQIFWNLFIGIGAYGGAFMMIAYPSGIFGMEEMLIVRGQQVTVHSRSNSLKLKKKFKKIRHEQKY